MTAAAPTDQPHPFRKVAIVGLGLVGGSLARALKIAERPPRVSASSRSVEDLRKAGREGAIDAASTDSKAILDDADLVVYATPLDVTLRLLEEHSSDWPEKAIVTDVASLKAPVLDRIRSLGESARYVGSHPMAGGEGSGFASSSPDLLSGTIVWLVGDHSEDGPGHAIEGFWRTVGADPNWIDGLEHDRRMAWCSHLPQLAANAMAYALENAGYSASELGTGGRDMVRLAASSPEMWLPLLSASVAEVVPALRTLGRTADKIADLLAAGDFDALEELMKSTSAWRA